jgi:LPS-assembly protein
MERRSYARRLVANRTIPLWVALVCGLAAVAAPIAGARAQFRLPGSSGAPSAGSSNAPVTFTADQVEYDKERSLVIARGAVEAWQNEHVLRADEIVFNRDTGVANATGHVVLLEPDGQTLFARAATLTNQMRDGELYDMGALLAENGRMAANGARRTGGLLNELSRVVYSSCNLCIDDPTKAPLWQIRAASGVQDLEHQVIEYNHAFLDIYGQPVAYFPFLAAPDPSVQRRSGLMIPWLGNSSNIGAFVALPYYWAIDSQSDATFVPMLTTKTGPQLDVQYRRAFNSGNLLTNISAGYVSNQMQGTIVARGQFVYDDTWRWGFDINRASSILYLRDFHTGLDLMGSLNLLPSTLYAEGFGQGSYTRFDVISYQSLSTTIADSSLPLAVPRYLYSYFGQPDRLGGRLSVDLSAFNILRGNGTDARRAAMTLNWERPATGMLGDRWKFTLHGDAAAYDATQLNNQPNFGMTGRSTTARGLPQIGIDWRWPFARDAGAWGTQLIEPMAQLILAPRAGDSQLFRIPNEDSFDFEFSDNNLFGFNRFPGIDRQTGGTRLNAAIHGAWYLGGTAFDGLVGQSYRTYKDKLFPAASGLRDQVSDVVARGTLSPTKWLDLTYRTRLDAKTMASRMVDTVATVGTPRFRIGGGYTYSVFNPYTYYIQGPPPPAGSPYYKARNEVSLTASSGWDKYRVAAFARRDLASNRMVAFGGDLIYEDECFILDLKFNRRYTTYLYENSATTVLLQFTFKTVGQFSYRAL